MVGGDNWDRNPDILASAGVVDDDLPLHSIVWSLIPEALPDCGNWNGRGCPEFFQWLSVDSTSPLPPQ